MGKTYDIIKLFERNASFYDLFKNGVISLCVLDKKVYYEYYLSRIKSFGKSEALKMTAVEFDKSERTIRRAIDFMEK